MLAYAFYERDARIRRYVSTLADRGDTVDVIALRREDYPYYESADGVDVYRIQTRQYKERGPLSYLLRIVLFMARATVLLVRTHRKRKYDVIHVHSIPDFLVFAAAPLKLAGVKVILDIHDILPELYASKFNGTSGGFMFKALCVLERMSGAVSDHVIVANHIWQERLASRSVAREKCTVVLNYPDPTVFYRRTRNRTDGKFILIYPGSLNRHQGVETAIRAFAMVKDEIPEAEFHIYGKGPDKGALQRLSLELGVEDRVLFRDMLDLEQIASVVANSDLGVEPKGGRGFANEALSTKTFEFMALGIPVVVSDTQVHRHYFNGTVVEFFRSGDVVDLARGILMLRRDVGLRNRLIMGGSDYMRQNNWESKKHEYLDLVDRVTGCCKRATGVGRDGRTFTRPPVRPAR